MQPFFCFSHHIGKTTIMKKLILLSLFLPLFATAQTIPNGNFENWSMVGMNENPDFWVTDNTEIYTTVSKDLDAYEGEIAMRVTAQPTGLNEQGEATTLFEISAIPPALNFYAKSEVESGSVNVEITFLNEETEIYSKQWFSTASMEEYTLVSIPLNQMEPQITHARIKVMAEVGDLIAGTAWISVDAMEFGIPLMVKESALTSFKIYPNPASEYLTIQSAAGPVGNVMIFDTQGKMVFEKRISGNSGSIDIRSFSPGVYAVRSDAKNVRGSTFIVK